MAQFNRPPRLISPLPKQVVKLPKIPTLTEKNISAEWLTMVLPFAAVILSAVIMFSISGAGSTWTTYLLFIPIMACSYLASALVSSKQKKEYQKKLNGLHAKLNNELFTIEKTLSDLNQEERRKRFRVDPDIAECLKRVQDADPRLGERRPSDDDFLHVRIGTGNVHASYQIHQEEIEQESDEFIKEINSLKDISTRYETIPDAPYLIHLPETGSLGICGDQSISQNITYSILCQVMTHHWPDEVRISVICALDDVSEWKWLEKSPHSSHLLSAMINPVLKNDPRGVMAAVMKDLELELQQREQTYEAKKLLKHEGENPALLTPLPRLILIFDDVEVAFNHPAVSLLLEKGKELGVYGIFLTNHSSRVPGQCSGIINVQDEKVLYKQSGMNTQVCTPDLMNRKMIDAFVDALAEIPFPSGGATSQPPEQVTFLQMFNARRVEDLPIEEWWNGKSPYGYLRAPIGRTSPTSDWIFDLNDRDGAHGPHGLLGGMTGSGKSEALKAIILALAVTHHPYDLNFALVDFKGGAAFNELRNLPHTVGVVTDIESNPTFAERVIQSLTGEIERRKKILENARSTFQFGRSHIDEYREKLRTRRPLPRLLIVFDEFAEFKTRNPEESRKLIGIARQGRSLGVHLLLATQNIASAIDPEIMQNSTYKICLRVSEPQDSVQMIGIPDAVSLKRGRAYFSVSSRVLYQSAYSGADYIPSEVGESVPNSMIRIYPDGRRETVSMLAWKNPSQNQLKTQPATEAAAVVEHLSAVASKMGLKKPTSVWQDALPDRLYLPDIFEKSFIGGWNGEKWLPCRLLTDRTTEIATVAPYLGLYDDPQEQSQPCFQVDLSQGGNLLIFGSAGSGKSTLLRTFVTSLALTHAPDQLHVYVLDYGGQPRLKILEAFPHVGAVITRIETERTQRLVSYLSSEILRRNSLMRKAKVDNWVDYNAQEKDNEKFPEIYLLIDGFINFKDSFEPEMVKSITMLLSGQSAGIHLAISSYIQSDLPNELFANINNRISLFQANPNEYQGLVGFLSEARLQEDAVLGMRPGRGLLRRTSPLSFQAALPTRGENDQELSDHLTALAVSMRSAWRGKPIPPEIQFLDEFIYLPPAKSELNNSDFCAKIGVRYQDLQTVGFSLRQDSNAFLVSSTSPRVGKTTFLQMWMLRLAELYPPSRLEIKIVSYHSQSLLSMKNLPHGHLIKYKPAFQDFLSQMNRTLTERLQTQEQQIQSDIDNFDPQIFMDQFPQILIVIDDYGKFFTATGDNEKTQLMDLLQRGADVGIGFIISDTISNLPRPFQDNFLGKLSNNGYGILLGGADGIDLFNNARITPGQPVAGLPNGRGYLIRQGRTSLFQAGVWWQANEDPNNALQTRLARLC